MFYLSPIVQTYWTDFIRSNQFEALRVLKYTTTHTVYEQYLSSLEALSVFKTM